MSWRCGEKSPQRSQPASEPIRSAGQLHTQTARGSAPGGEGPSGTSGVPASSLASSGLRPAHLWHQPARHLDRSLYAAPALGRRRGLTTNFALAVRRFRAPWAGVPFPLVRAPFPCAVRPSPLPCAVAVRRGVGLGEQNPLVGVRVRGVGEQPRVRVLQGADGMVLGRGGPPLVPLCVGRADDVVQGAHEVLHLEGRKGLSVQRHHRAVHARGE